MFELLLAICVVVVVVGIWFFLRLRRVFGGDRLESLADDAAKGRERGERLLVCFGDSLTLGHHSYNWVSDLEKSEESAGYAVLNAGCNGELAYNLVQRLESVTELKPERVTLLVGTNDARAIDNLDAAKVYQKGQKLPQLPDEAFFEANFETLLCELESRCDAEVIVVGIPMLGERQGEPVNELVERMNGYMRDRSSAHGMEFVDLYGALREHLRGQDTSAGPSYSGSASLRLMMKSVFLRFGFGWSWQRIAKRNRLLVLTDMIHLNETGGRILLELVRERLSVLNRE
ncbi:SGNH/GDSL hydrolase family protein [Pelagicoccus mobilis]|uniref:SGNH/GDSL hydrolase family protein n=1 Tax=Pelagicoccus mobilis TaxID=415221 RepID=A0A934VRE7_9BACT|nr:SGNH/GDSL hydrolase family protein [Pelagicoccus mobilis]MBK1879322.1 SGNH/GDSL hydrolase family protein [Pelagicoccus mobilis]